MSTTVLLDTCILVDALRARTAAQRRTAAALRALVPGHVPAVSVVTVAELVAGRRPQEVPAVRALLASTVRFPVDDAVAERAGDYLRSYARSHAVELGDALVAATAAVHGLALWTENAKHFPMPDVHMFAPP